MDTRFYDWLNGSELTNLIGWEDGSALGTRIICTLGTVAPQLVLFQFLRHLKGKVRNSGLTA